ncbi:MAG: AraC family transcriptional regulator [Verrucomicrobiia bacterium]
MAVDYTLAMQVSFASVHWPILNMGKQPAIFRGNREHYRADTCRPVEVAAKAGLIRMNAVAHGTYPGLKLADKLMPELRSAGSWDVPCNQAWGLDWHRNEGVEFVFIESGRLGFAVDDQSYPLRPGHLTVTRPWQRHRLGLPHVEACRMIWLILDVGMRRPHQSWRWPRWLILTTSERERLTTLLRHNEQPVWKADATIASCFAKIARLTARESQPFDRTRMALAINELLLAICEMLDRRGIPLDDSLTTTRRSVELFLSELPRRVEEPWTVDTMAQQCGLKRSRFTSYCRQLTNMSPTQYLAHCRVDTSARLLREQPNLSIIDIALACGFSTSQYFATTFRQLKGQTPRQWRNAVHPATR